jgi:hypothetical protein
MTLVPAIIGGHVRRSIVWCYTYWLFGIATGNAWHMRISEFNWILIIFASGDESQMYADVTEQRRRTPPRVQFAQLQSEMQMCNATEQHQYMHSGKWCVFVCWSIFRISSIKRTWAWHMYMWRWHKRSTIRVLRGFFQQTGTEIEIMRLSIRVAVWLIVQQGIEKRLLQLRDNLIILYYTFMYNVSNCLCVS